MIRGLKLRLEEYCGLATASEQAIINFILTTSDQVAGISMSALAKLTCTSPSTIIRLCRKLGCSGYREFQQSLMREVAIASQTDSVVTSDVLSSDSTQAIIDKVTLKNVSSLKLTAEDLDAEAINRAVSLLASARSVCLFGVGASLLVARDLQLKLLRLDIPCNLCDDLHAQLLCAKNMRAGDLSLAVSYSGLTTEVLDCVRVARANGARVVSITRGGYGSPLVSLSDVVLGVAATELVKRTGAMSSRIAQLNVVDILFVSYVNAHYAQSIKRLSSNWIEKGSDVRRPAPDGKGGRS